MSYQTQPQKPSTQQIVSAAADRLLDALRQGRSEAMTDYLRVMGRFHRYSFNNVLLIAQQRPTASHMCGFKTWLSLGRHVRKGEKGIQILAPVVGKKKTDDAAPEDDRKEMQVFGFRAVYVFERLSRADRRSARQRLADPMELVLSEVAAIRYMLLTLFHSTAQARREGVELLPETVLQIRDSADRRKLQTARKMLDDFINQNVAGGQP